MTDQTIPQTVLFPELFDRPLVPTFDQAQASSDGGAILLKAADARLGVTVALADDPIQKLLLDRDPLDGTPLASQPTISRFENGVSRAELYQMGQALAMRVVDRHQRRLHSRARRITIDPTDDTTHRAQQLSFFNGHYDTWCYLPLLAFVTFNDQREQYLCAAILRSGNAPASLGALGLLRRLVPLLRTAFPEARLRLRLDGGFACPEVFAFLEGARLDYVTAMGKNAVLAREVEPSMIDTRALHAIRQHTAHVYTEASYQAQTWVRPRRVIIKAEVVQHPGRAPRDNPRFVVTNLRQTPEWLYTQVYCARGDIENRIKELQPDLATGRTSCSRFWANQLRVLLTAAAYVLMQELRLRAAHTSCAHAQVATPRLRLLKLGVRVVGSVRRIVLHLPVSSPDASTWPTHRAQSRRPPRLAGSAHRPRSHVWADVCLRAVRVRSARSRFRHRRSRPPLATRARPSCQRSVL